MNNKNEYGNRQSVLETFQICGGLNLYCLVTKPDPLIISSDTNKLSKHPNPGRSPSYRIFLHINESVGSINSFFKRLNTQNNELHLECLLYLCRLMWINKDITKKNPIPAWTGCSCPGWGHCSFWQCWSTWVQLLHKTGLNIVIFFIFLFIPLKYQLKGFSLRLLVYVCDMFLLITRVSALISLASTVGCWSLLFFSRNTRNIFQGQLIKLHFSCPRKVPKAKARRT